MKHLIFVAFCLVILDNGFAQQKQITVDDLYKNYTFSAKDVPGFNSMKDGKYYTEVEDNNLIRKSFATGKTVDTLITASELKTTSGETVSLDNYSLSDDESKVLIRTNINYIYRRSYYCVPYVFDLKTQQLSLVTDDNVLHPTLSPDGTKVAFVKDNNLYYKDLASGKITQVTTDGKRNNIINGNCDWVYEEEFEFTRAFQWSPNSDYIAYYRFDESQVKEYTIPFYLPQDNYPVLYTYKYPKAGEDNSLVTIHTYSLASGQTQNMNVGAETDQYIPRIKWTTKDTVLCIYRLNRLQNKLELLLDNVQSGDGRVLYAETNKWYFDEGLYDDIRFLKDGRHFIMMSEKDGWRHVYLYDMNGKEESQLTPGNYDVDAIAGVDEKHELLYYTSAEYSPMDRQLFVVNFKGKHKVQLTEKRGWHNIAFSTDDSYFVDNYSTINTPPVFTLKDNKGKTIRMLEDNVDLKQTMAQYELSRAHFIKVPNSEGDTLNGWMLKPSDFDSTKQYPVIFMNYGGPGSQSVMDEWGTVDFWQQMLAEKGYIVVCIDNRGTGFRGEYFKKQTYLRLGEKEIADQIDAAKYLGKLPYINAKRIGHWGWSYGGFMSCLAITKGADVFSMAIAVAPVTNWKYYDNIYTERYMRTPQENPKGYEETSPINYVDKIKGKFLIIHGTGDDNVHFQNSVMMVNAMIADDIPFTSAYYPNRNHGIYGGNTRLHLYKKMTKFILDNL